MHVSTGHPLYLPNQHSENKQAAYAYPGAVLLQTMQLAPDAVAFRQLRDHCQVQKSCSNTLALPLQQLQHCAAVM